MIIIIVFIFIITISISISFTACNSSCISYGTISCSNTISSSCRLLFAFILAFVIFLTPLFIASAEPRRTPRMVCATASLEFVVASLHMRSCTGGEAVVAFATFVPTFFIVFYFCNICCCTCTRSPSYLSCTCLNHRGCFIFHGSYAS